MSQYDNITTAKDLVFEVRQHGLSTVQEDLNRAADIFGNSPVSELAALANDNGREDGNGNPDPNGTWSSGKRGTSRDFYFIAFSIWNWEDATRFWNQHTNPETAAAKKTAEELKSRNEEVRSLARDREEAWRQVHEITEQKIYEHSERVNAAVALEAAQREVLTLKAKLYDLTIAGPNGPGPTPTKGGTTMTVLFKDPASGIEAGINDDGNLYFGDDQSGYNLTDTPENRRRIERDIQRYTGSHTDLAI